LPLISPICRSSSLVLILSICRCANTIIQTCYEPPEIAASFIAPFSTSRYRERRRSAPRPLLDEIPTFRPHVTVLTGRSIETPCGGRSLCRALAARRRLPYRLFGPIGSSESLSVDRASSYEPGHESVSPNHSTSIGRIQSHRHAFAARGRHMRAESAVAGPLARYYRRTFAAVRGSPREANLPSRFIIPSPPAKSARSAIFRARFSIEQCFPSSRGSGTIIRTSRHCGSCRGRITVTSVYYGSSRRVE